jgi:hypothetical protein
MSAKPAHHRLRELLLHVLRTDADFEAFPSAASIERPS